MASETGIVNLALTLLGESRIISLDDDTKPAREAKALYEISRDALLAGYNWSFAATRAQIPALVGAPVFGFGMAYQLPSDCLRIILLNEEYVGVDLTDYRGAPVEKYAIEGRQILTDWSAPLNIRYVKRVTDTAQFSPNFTKAFGCQLAVDLAETLTQSGSKRDRAEAQLNKEISLAIRANAIELHPKRLADDDWVLSRL